MTPPAAFDLATTRARIIARLVQARESAGLSVAEAARRFQLRSGIKMDRSQLVRRESGETQFQIEELPIFADIYGKDGVGWFFL